MSPKAIVSFFFGMFIISGSMIYSCVNLPFTSPQQERFNYEIEQLEDMCAEHPEYMGCGDPSYK